jgi:hypothetical protein
MAVVATGIPYLSLRNIYPNITDMLSTGEQTIPEESDQQGMGASVSTGAMPGQMDVLKTVAFVALLIFLLMTFGIVQ